MKFLNRFKAGPSPQLTADSLPGMIREVESIASGGLVSAESLERHSEERGVPLAHLYAGVGMSFEVSLATENELQMVICVGNCRERGAMDCAASLLELQKKRKSKGLKSFDLVPRDCLSRCMQGPALEIRSKDGKGVLTEATPKQATRAVKELLD